MLKDKCKVKWLESRDRNSAFLHSLLQILKVQHPLSALVVDGVLTSDPDVIKLHVIDFNKGLFSDSVSNVLDDFSILDNVIPSLVYLQENQSLMALLSFEEIKLVVFAMDSSSVPGPDDFGGVFFFFFFFRKLGYCG